MRVVYFIVIVILLSSHHVLASSFKIQVLDKNNKPLTNMVVYLQPEEGVVLPVSSKTIEIDQFDRAFIPHINVMQLGNRVRFQNNDDITHHIYSPIGENKFSFKIHTGQSQHKDDFQQLGEVSMGCNIHDWMNGYLYIVDTPLFGKTNDHGMVEIEMTVRGKYKLVVWHPLLEAEGHSISQQIEWPTSNEISIIISNKIGKTMPQKNDDDFDFLSDY